MRKLFTIITLVTACVASYANGDAAYYQSLDGLSGEALKTAIYRLCRDNIQLTKSIAGTYSGFASTFAQTDAREIDGVEYWWDMYSTTLNPLTMSFSECSYQREHALPKSWWKDTTKEVSDGVSFTTAYCDMHHLYPSNGSANQSKSNWPLGEVGNATFDNGAVKVGAPAEGLIYGIDDAVSISKVFEPADEYKGDFARAYMYVVTAYQDLTWASNCLWMVDNNLYPTFTPWAADLIKRWHRLDPVSQKEIIRNDAVETLQHNRNPYIDLPNLYEYVWGDSVGVPLRVTTTLKAGQEPVEPEIPVLEDKVYYHAAFTGGDTGDCAIEDNSSDIGFDVWTSDNRYGWKASGYNSGSAHATDACLVTPEIDLSNAQEAYLSFSHAINYSDASPMKVYIRDNTRSNHDITSSLDWPQTPSWNFVDTRVPLTSHLGKKIQVVFHYTSTPATAGTWEIKNLDVSGQERTTSIHPSTVNDSVITPIYYSIDGRRVDPATHRGPAIRLIGNIATKTYLR